MTKARLKSLFVIALALSLGLHALIGLVMLVQHHDAHSTVVPPSAPPKIVEAVAVNQHDVEREIANVRAEQANEARARQQEIERYQQALRATEQRRNQEQQKLASLSKAKQRLSAKLKADTLKAKQQAKQQALAQEAMRKKAEQLRQQTAQEQARLAKITQEKHKAELKRQQEALAMQKAEEKRKQAELLAKKLKDEQLAKLKAQRKEALDKAMMDQLHAEQKNISAVTLAHRAREMARFKKRIVATIAHSWRVPYKTDKSLSCELFIKVAPGGTVMNVQTIRSSGNALMDSSARTAVYKASPLPVPADADAFKDFQELRLTVRPERIVSS